MSFTPSMVAVAIAMQASEKKSIYPHYPTHKEKYVSGFFEPLHRKVIAAVLAVLLFVLLLASCTPRQQVAYGPAYAPAHRYAEPTYRQPVAQSYQSSRSVTTTVTSRPTGGTRISVGRRR